MDNETYTFALFPVTNSHKSTRNLCVGGASVFNFVNRLVTRISLTFPSLRLCVDGALVPAGGQRH